MLLFGLWLVVIGAGIWLGVAFRPTSVNLAIPGANGYYTYTGPRGLPLAVGAPWGTSCKPIVFTVERNIPAAIYQQMHGVVLDARAAGVDVTLENINGQWYPESLYPPGLVNAKVEFIPIYVSSSKPPTSSGGYPGRIYFGWDTKVSPNGTHEVLTDLQATLYLKSVSGGPYLIRKSMRQLIAISLGVSTSTLRSSVITDGSNVDSFSSGDMTAMRLMSGCSRVS